MSKKKHDTQFAFEVSNNVTNRNRNFITAFRYKIEFFSTEKMVRHTKTFMLNGFRAQTAEQTLNSSLSDWGSWSMAVNVDRNKQNLEPQSSTHSQATLEMKLQHT